MALAENPFEKVGRPVDPLANHEEDRARVDGFESIQDGRGDLRVGAVVEGKEDVLRCAAIEPPDREAPRDHAPEGAIDASSRRFVLHRIEPNIIVSGEHII
jgi:hypothetical protein